VRSRSTPNPGFKEKASVPPYRTPVRLRSRLSLDCRQSAPLIVSVVVLRSSEASGGYRKMYGAESAVSWYSINIDQHFQSSRSILIVQKGFVPRDVW